MFTINRYTIPAAVIRSTRTMRVGLARQVPGGEKRGRLEPVMMGIPIASGAGDAQETLNREYSGSATAGTISAVSPPLTCSAQLQQWEATDKVPPGESCDCPPGATAPDCTPNPNNLAECQAYMASTETSKDTDCTCTDTSPVPSCSSYYDLCEANLSGVQTQYNICTCTNPQTTPNPACISKYQVCENGLAGVQAANPGDVCACHDPQTVTTPTCTPDIEICDQNINSYENNDDVCHCTDSSTKPVCVSKYSICEGKMSSYQTADNRCACSQTSTTPSCQSFYDICEASAQQYENGDTTCSCSSNSTKPDCCTQYTSTPCATTGSCSNGQKPPSTETDLLVGPVAGSLQNGEAAYENLETTPGGIAGPGTEEFYCLAPSPSECWSNSGADRNCKVLKSYPVKKVENCQKYVVYFEYCSVPACTSHRVCNKVTHKSCKVE